MVMPIKNDSVLLAIAEVRFNPILNLDKYVPEIQDELRKKQHPEFAHIQNHAFHYKQDAENKIIPTVHDIYQFSNINISSQFRLNSQCLTFQTSDYKNFETYLNSFMKGLLSVNKILQLAYVERIGLRYIERVVAKKGDRIQRYLGKQEIGLHEKLGNNAVYSYSEVKHLVDDIQLINRVKVFQNSGIEFPHDIDPGDMVFPKRLLTFNGPNAIIDTDAFIEKREEMQSTTVWSHLFELHDLTTVAFEASVSDLAKKVKPV